jgi:NDP-sugar pyrophosphorylase family protein
MKAVILAGGLGTRLMPLTKIIPKPLLPVGEKSLLEITILNLKKFGFDEVILATNYKSDLFESYFGDGSKIGIKITYSKEKEPLGTAGPLLLVEDKLTEPFLVMNGDILTNMDFSKLIGFHKENSADFTVVSKKLEHPLHYGVVKTENNKVTAIEEKPVIESEINAGIYILSPNTLSLIPENKFFTMTELIKSLITNKNNVLRYQLNDYWLDIGHMSDYKKAQDDIKQGLV